ESRTIKAQAVAMLGTDDTKIARSAIAIGQDDGGRVLILLQNNTPDDNRALSDLGMAILSAIHLAHMPVDESAFISPTEQRARLVPIDRLQVLDANEANAPAGHAVLELYIGSVPLR